MKKMKNALIVGALIIAVGGVILAKRRQKLAEPPKMDAATEAISTKIVSTVTPQEQPLPLPRLLDLGADKCMPCKMMAPILEEMKTTYAGQLQVDFIDVWKNPRAAQEYGIRVIPTQIFFGPDGKELGRHEGFMSREAILAQWRKFGITLKDPGVE